MVPESYNGASFVTDRGQNHTQLHRENKTRKVFN